MGQSWRDITQLSAQQRLVRESIRELCEEFSPNYWREKDQNGDSPDEFVNVLEKHGRLGILIPERYGGGGMRTPEAVVMMEEIAANGGGFSAAQAIHGGIYNSILELNKREILIR